MELIFIGIFFIGLPIALTVLNVINLVKNRKELAYWLLPLIVVIGSAFYKMLLDLEKVTGQWYEVIIDNEIHEPISYEHWAGFILPVALGYIGLAFLIYGDDEKKPPLLSAFSIAAVLVGDVSQVLMMIQVCNGNFDILCSCCFCLYHINVLLISVYAVRRQIISQIAIFDIMRAENDDPEGQELKISPLYKLMNNVKRYPLLLFICLFVFIGLLEIVFIISGQGYDAFFKTFTDTADWTFSKQIPPPPIEYEGHYLCTVAAGGHKKIVKPLRFGMRRGAVIIVNRQLCIANAFEDYIHEKMPKFHKFIRHCYDKYGFPISQKIDTPVKADIVYYLMKPLEWAFLVFLYLFDTRPEKRIRNQYVMK